MCGKFRIPPPTAAMALPSEGLAHGGSCRVTISPYESTNNYGDLTRFEVDAAETTLWDVLRRIHEDPLLSCLSVRIGTTLSSYEDDVTGPLIDLADPRIALRPLAAIVEHLLPEAAKRGHVSLVEGQTISLIVGGCATEAGALEYAAAALLTAQFEVLSFKHAQALEEERKEAAEREAAEAKREATLSSSPPQNEKNRHRGGQQPHT